MGFLGGSSKGSNGSHNPASPSKSLRKKKETDKPEKETDKSEKESGKSEKGENSDKTDLENTDATETKPEEQIEQPEKPETETEHNTRLNALLYHTSNETVDLYRQENNSSDLLGRLYYDDYDSESAVTSPILSGSVTPSGGELDHSNMIMNSLSLNSINSTLSNHRNTKGGRSSSNIASMRASHISPARSASPSNIPGALGSHHASTSSHLSIPMSSVPLRSSSSTNLAPIRPALAKANSFDKPLRPSLSRLQSSSTSSFQKGISFDASSDDHRMSITYKVKHPQFKFRRNNKTFLAGFNDDQESFKAIEWLFDEMVIHGDTIIVLQALDEKKYDVIDKAKVNELLSRIEQLNKHVKKVSLVFEVVIGKPQKLLKKAIEEYKPAMMIIGTHNHDKKEHKSFLSKSSLSKHFLECALVPVIVVNPTYRYVEHLENPITTETFFEDWMKNINYDNLLTKDKTKRSKLNMLSPTSSRVLTPTSSRVLSPSSSRLLSPSTSRNGSHTNLLSLHEDRGRGDHSKHDGADDDEKDLRSNSSSRSRSRSTSKSRGFAKFFHHR